MAPHQLLCNLNPVLGKPSEQGHPPGIRTICKTPMLYRIAARCDKTVVEWESKYTASYDTSGKGCSALQAALLRASLAEVSGALNSHAGGVFHGFQKFSTPLTLHRSFHRLPPLPSPSQPSHSLYQLTSARAPSNSSKVAANIYKYISLS